MVVFQSDIMRQDAINPILAALINVIINRNFSVQRDTPLIFSADEFPTIYLPQSPTWANEHRSKGYVGLYGFQSFPQLRDRYGREKADILLSGVGTHFWFNPGNSDTAKDLSQFLGEEEITIKQKSQSRTVGSNNTKSVSEQTRTKPLLQSDEFLRFDTGECVLLNPAYKNQESANLPQHIKQMKIPQDDLELIKDYENLWMKEVLPSLRKREQKRSLDLDQNALLQLRFEEAERLLPAPPEEGEETSTTARGGQTNKLQDL